MFLLSKLFFNFWFINDIMAIDSIQHSHALSYILMLLFEMILESLILNVKKCFSRSDNKYRQYILIYFPFKKTLSICAICNCY